MILTFYSYKGGVGRSMALSNVADTLARQGLRVLMIDFDLEAPGLEQFFPINHNQVRSHLGLVDLLLSYKQAMSQASSTDLEQSSFRQLKELFIVPIYDQLPSGGRLDLLPAGQRGDEEQLANYALSLRTFDWQDFYFNWAGELFFDWLRRTLRSLYDLVLVDSRTGVTEMGGICAYQLADSIAMFCASNQQNLYGTLNVIQNFYSPRVQILRRNRPLQLLVVPSRVEQRDNPLLEDFNQRFNEAFSSFTPKELSEAGLSFWDLVIPYEPHYAFKEQVVTSPSRPAREPQVSAAYQKLVDAIIAIADPESPIARLRSNGQGSKSFAEAQYDITRTQAGYDLFLYYHAGESEAVQPLILELEKRPEELTTFDPQPLLRGDAWQTAVEHALEESRACLVLLGPDLHAPWENEELRGLIEKRLSSHRPFEIIPVLLPGAKPPDPERVPSFLSGKKWNDFRGGFTSESLDELIYPLVSSPASTPSSGKHLANPYKGLSPFQQQDAALFSGREALVQKALEHLEDSCVLFIIGPSGSGKSSLVNAGLIPALREGALSGSKEWRFVNIRPGVHPLDTLAAKLAQFLKGDSFDPHTTTELRLRLEHNENELFHIADEMGIRKKGSHLVLVIDPLEEIWSLAEAPEERQTFLRQLIRAATAPDTPYTVIFVLRSDYFSETASELLLRDLVADHQLLVGPMTRDELAQAILAPAQKAGIAFEPGLPEVILDEVEGQPGALPLMQFVLQLLWERQSQGFLTLKAYKSIGGMSGALSQQADYVCSQLSEDELELTRQIFIRLVSWGKEEVLTRRRVAIKELIPAGGSSTRIEAIVQRFVDARLLVTGLIEQTDEVCVQIAHESLIRAWPRLQTWLEGDRQLSLALRQLSEDAKTWEEQKRNTAFLYRGARLQEAESWAAMYVGRLNALELEFIRTSRLARDRQQRLNVVISIMGILSLAVLAIFGFIQADLARNAEATAVNAQSTAVANAYIAKTESANAISEANARATAQANAEGQQMIALARQLAAQSQSVYSVVGKGRLLSALLAIESIRLLPSIEGFQSLQRGLIGLPRVVSSFNEATPVLRAAFSLDGKLVATGSQDGTVSVLEAATGRLIFAYPSGGAVNAVSFSPDGKFLVSSSQNGTVRVSEAVNGAPYKEIDSSDPSLPARFTPDGRYVVSVQEDGTFNLLDMETREQVGFDSFGGRVVAFAISPDSMTIISVSGDGTILLLDIPQQSKSGIAFSDVPLTNVAFSSSGRSIVISSEDGTLSRWNVPELKELFRIFTDGSIVALAFSPDEKLILAGRADGSIQVLDAVSGEEITQMKHDGPLTSMAVSRDGNYVVSGSEDGTARVWEIATGLEILRMTHDGPVRTVAFGPNAKTIISAGDDKSVRVWELSSAQEAVALMQHDAAINAMEFSPNGKWILSASDDGTARVWEAVNGLEISRMNHDSVVTAAAFNGKGDLVASAGLLDGVRLWEAATGKERSKIMGVGALAFSPDDKLVAFSQPSPTGPAVISSIYLVDVNSTKAVTTLSIQGLVSTVIFSEDGTYILAGTTEGLVQVWETQSEKEAAGLSLDGAVSALAFSPDGQYIAAASTDTTARVWAVGTWKEISQMTYDDAVFSIAFSPDGKYVISGSADGTARVWEAETGKEISRMTHDGTVNDVAFSPDGKYAISGSQDGTARVWEVATGNEVARMPHDSPVTHVAFSPEGKYVASASADGEIRVWLWRVDDLIEEVCKRLPRNLTEEEWTQFLGERPYQATCPNLPVEPGPAATTIP